MKRLILCALLMVLSYPAFADVLIPGRDFKNGVQAQRMKRERELKNKQLQLNCPADKPLLAAGGRCYSCDVLYDIPLAPGINCSEICPNREGIYTCGFSCVLTNPPADNYIYKKCYGWVLK